MKMTIQAALAVMLLAAPAFAQTRAIIPPTTAPGRYPTAGATLNVTDAQTVVLNQFLFSGDGRELLLAYNCSDTTVNVSVISKAESDLGNRTGDIISEDIAPWRMHIFGPFAGTGWRQTDGYIYTEADSANVTYAVIRIP